MLRFVPPFAREAFDRGELVAIDESVRVSVPAALSANWTDAITVTLAPAEEAYVLAYGHDVETAGFTYDGNILWRLVVGGSSPTGYGGWGEHRATVLEPRETLLKVGRGAKIIFQVRRAVAAGAANFVNMAVVGVRYRIRSAPGVPLPPPRRRAGHVER